MRAVSTGQRNSVAIVNAVDLEHAGLAECETVIQRGFDAWLEAGRALLRIRDGELYRPRYRTFEHYCSTRWKFTTPRAHQLVAAAETVEVITGGNGNCASNGHVPNNERVARELAPLRAEPDTMRAAWHEATVEASREGREPTSTDVRRAVRGRALGPVTPTPTDPEPGSEEKVTQIVETWALLARGIGETIRLERELKVTMRLTDNQLWQIAEARKHAWMRLDNEQ